MKKNLLNSLLVKECAVRKIAVGLSMAFAVVACSKSENHQEMGTGITISKSGLWDEPIEELDIKEGGGKDTVYIFSASDINIEIETGQADKWIEIVEQEYINDLKATRVVFEIAALEDDFSRRVGTLKVNNEELYSRNFLKLYQGYVRRYADDFSWLRYGNGNPLEQITGVLLGQWNPAQQERGWTSTILEGQERAFVYGKNDYVQLGSETVGANFISPIVSGIQRDSLLLLTFNAVAFISDEGVPDDNKLTVKLTGGEFSTGEVSQVVDLEHFDNESALLTTKMWEKSMFTFVIHKPELNAEGSTIQIQFMNGAETEAAKNRVFLGEINLYTKDQFEQEER